MSTVLEQHVVALLRQAGHVLLLTDERLDGDTLGSTLGFAQVLRDMGKRVTLFSPRTIPAHFAFIPGAERIRTDDVIFLDPGIDLAIICDCSDGEYIKRLLPRMPRKVPLVMFDHHATNPRYGTYNFVEPEAASTADIVWRFVKRNKLPINRFAAQCFLTGICTDTSLFSTSNTTAAAFDAAVELTKRGAKLTDVVRHTMMNRPVPILKIWGKMLERLHFNAAFQAVCTVLPLKDWEELGKPDVETSALSNFLNATLTDADTIVILRETDDGAVKGSLRSRGRDVAALAETFGGGGHKLASGFKVPHAHLEERDGQWHIVPTPART